MRISGFVQVSLDFNLLVILRNFIGAVADGLAGKNQLLGPVEMSPLRREARLRST